MTFRGIFIYQLNLDPAVIHKTFQKIPWSMNPVGVRKYNIQVTLYSAYSSLMYSRYLFTTLNPIDS